MLRWIPLLLIYWCDSEGLFRFRRGDFQAAVVFVWVIYLFTQIILGFNEIVIVCISAY